MDLVGLGERFWDCSCCCLKGMEEQPLKEGKSAGANGNGRVVLEGRRSSRKKKAGPKRENEEGRGIAGGEDRKEKKEVGLGERGRERDGWRRRSGKKKVGSKRENEEGRGTAGGEDRGRRRPDLKGRTRKGEGQLEEKIGRRRRRRSAWPAGEEKERRKIRGEGGKGKKQRKKRKKEGSRIGIKKRLG